MPPVFGPRSPSWMRLKSWAEASGSAVVAVAERQQRELLAGEVLLDHDALGAEAVLDEHLLQRLACLRLVGGDHDPLAGREPVRLDHAPGSGRSPASPSCDVGDHPRSAAVGTPAAP